MVELMGTISQRIFIWILETLARTRGDDPSNQRARDRTGERERTRALAHASTSRVTAATSTSVCASGFSLRVDAVVFDVAVRGSDERLCLASSRTGVRISAMCVGECALVLCVSAFASVHNEMEDDITLEPNARFTALGINVQREKKTTNISCKMRSRCN